jgi:hypothetical protein
MKLPITIYNFLQYSLALCLGDQTVSPGISLFLARWIYGLRIEAWNSYKQHSTKSMKYLWRLQCKYIIQTPDLAVQSPILEIYSDVESQVRGGKRYLNCLRHYATSRKSRVRFLWMSLDFFNWPNPSSRTMTLRPTQPLTEMSARNLPGEGRKVRPARKADNLTTLCEPTV